MSARTKVSVAVAAVLLVMASLVVVGMSKASTYYYTVDELHQQKEKAYGKSLKVSGKIVGDSVQWDQQDIRLAFDLAGDDGEPLSVVYNGVKPDTLNDGWEAIVEGKLDEQGVFQAKTLMVKCPSKYEAMDGTEGSDPYGYDKQR
jgi:cytochrome c-type biogenesis protein CcmE